MFTGGGGSASVKMNTPGRKVRMALIERITSNPAPEWMSGWTSVWPIQSAKSAVRALVATTVVHPLARLYLDGPTLLGFWGGAAPETICARLTGVDADFWSGSEDGQFKCAEVIQRHFDSWMVLASTAAYFVAAGAIITIAYRRCQGSRPTQPTHQIVVVPTAFPPPYTTKSSTNPQQTP